MSFEPPFCPNSVCVAHENPPAGIWWTRRGAYRPKCRTTPVPRFRCDLCERGFSRQTFRHDYRDHRPDVNTALFQQLVSGVGLRQGARNVGIDVRAALQKLRKFAATLAQLHDNLSPGLPAGRTFLLDEEETFERSKGLPLTMPVLIERDSWFVVACAVSSIRRLAREGSGLRRYQELHEAANGRRKDASRSAVRKVLEALARRLPAGALAMHTDEKSAYPRLLTAVFGDRVEHETTPGSAARTKWNPLFAINTTMAMTRDNNGRLRRRSWLHSKRAADLVSQMALFTVYRNYMRKRFNRDPRGTTPAKVLGLLPRAMTGREALAWRQVWGERSPHPFSADGAHPVGRAWSQRA